ncbi:Sulfotransferase domain-containing protein [Thiohalospira halophila DSM 15071]|uniref:Sulfotransferase domain-containing protein n=1 Tax=Thiohalospira halophila DSM 15071 TaxID=1123397 RepID=A0A1I1RRB8_9GAMM|nr:sulfotransferase domain-containing protein [Thiohalospira halophila]SFD36874.1 Sulfotransferase domain-containing protein [Thiohalospira halophila DSM 15071]
MTAIVRRRGPVRRAVQLARRRWRKWRAGAHLISYPKCGRTWLVMLIGKALEGHLGKRVRNPMKLRQFVRPWRDVPFILQHHDGGPEFCEPEELPRDKSEYAGRKVLFMVRDPRDVLVSSYFQNTRRNANFSGSMDEFVHQRRGGIETIVTFYNIWAANREVPSGFHLVAYEDLKADTAGGLRAALEFLGIHGVSDSVIQEAVEFCDFNNMRKLEASNALGTSRLAARDTSDPESFKTRKGEVGGYRDYLQGENLAHVERVINERLDPFYQRYLGYTDESAS